MLLLLVGLQSFGDTGLDVVANHHLADPAQRLVDGGDLGQDFHTPIRFLNHPPQTADLSLDDAQTSEGIFLNLFVEGNGVFNNVCDYTIPP